MWPFVERRRHRRYPVDWEATMHCDFPGRKEDVPVKVVEASMSGARLLLGQLQFGPYHLLADDDAVAFELTVHMPQAPVTSEIDIAWYNWSEDAQQFAVGVHFAVMSDENRLIWKQAIKETATAAEDG